MSQYGMIIDQDRCVGCRTCMAACKMEHNVPAKVFRMKVFNQEGRITNDRVTTKNGKYQLSWTPVPCMQCREPACVEECPANAITKRDDGVVYIDQDKCIGCETCLSACPYGVPEMMEQYGVADKCDMCRHRIDTGKNPICVDVCPSRAISFGEIDSPASSLGKRVKEEGFVQMKPEKGTNPSVYYRKEK